MKISLPFHVSALLMALLTFSMPFVTLAQQNSVQTEAEMATQQDINGVSLEAKVTVEQDAGSDINKLLWDMEVPATGNVVGVCTGCVIGFQKPLRKKFFLTAFSTY